jgi:hypothetical protein
VNGANVDAQLDSSDPKKNISSQVNNATINTVLNTGTSVLITTNIGGTDAGNITQNADAPISKTTGGDASLTLKAANNITLNGGISSTVGKLNVEIIANDPDQGGGATGAVAVNSNITTNGGDISISGKDIKIGEFTTANVDVGNDSLSSAGQPTVLLTTDGGKIDITGESVTGGGFETSSSSVDSGDVKLTSTKGDIIISYIVAGRQGKEGGDITVISEGLFQAKGYIPYTKLSGSGSIKGPVSIFGSRVTANGPGTQININAKKGGPFIVGAEMENITGTRTSDPNGFVSVTFREKPGFSLDNRSGTQGAIVLIEESNARFRVAYTDQGLTDSSLKGDIIVNVPAPDTGTGTGTGTDTGTGTGTGSPNLPQLPQSEIELKASSQSGAQLVALRGGLLSIDESLSISLANGFVNATEFSVAENGGVRLTGSTFSTEDEKKEEVIQ